MADLSDVKFFTRYSWDAERRVMRATLCTDSGKPVCAVDVSPLARTVTACRMAADGTFLPAGEFKAGERGPEIVHRARGAVVSHMDWDCTSPAPACPHCGNAEGNADRLRCFICNREL